MKVHNRFIVHGHDVNHGLCSCLEVLLHSLEEGRGLFVRCRVVVLLVLSFDQGIYIGRHEVAGPVLLRVHEAKSTVSSLSMDTM